MLPRIALAAALALVALPAAVAQGDVLIFTCGTAYANLCQSAPDGSSRSQLTTDATGQSNDVYASPSLSTSGSKLAFLRRGQLYVTDGASGKTAGPAGGPGAFLVARMKPDGSKVAVGEFGGPTGGAICTYLTTDLSGRDCAGSGGSLGWAGGDGIYTNATTAATGYRENVCLLVDDPHQGSGCTRFVTAESGADLYDAVGSPDGKLIAVTRGTDVQVRGTIAVYDAGTGALVRILTAGPNDGGPAWSPDSRSLVFDREGSGVMTVSVTASRTGTERLVAADGREPTWGGGSIGTAGKRCKMPKVTGRSLSAARAALQKAGCATPSVQGSTSSHAKVTRQSPAAGHKVAAGGKPKLTTRRA